MEFGLAIEPEAVLKDVCSSLDAALDYPIHLLSREGLSDWICRVNSAVAARVELLQANAAAVAVEKQVAPASRVRSIDQHVAARVPVDPARVRADLRIGQFLRRSPIFFDAFARGRLSRDHVDLMRRGVKKPFLRDALVDSQGYLVDAAKNLDWADFAVTWTQWLLAADPDGTQPKEQLDERFFRMRKQADGSYAGTFRLDPVSGHAVNRAVTFEERRLLDEFEELGDVRVSSRDHRMADAFASIMVRGIARTDRAVGAPVVHLSIGQKLAEEMLASSVEGDDRPLVSLQHDPDWRCELIDGTPIHPHLAMAILAVAEFKRLVLDADSAILDLGDSTRSLPPPLRWAVFAAARGRCRSPGCDAPFAWLQLDHRIPWSKQPWTSTENLEPRCGADNRFKGAR